MPKPMAPRPRKAIFSGIFLRDRLGSRDVFGDLEWGISGVRCRKWRE